jgi:hypothetical protein
MQLQKYILPFQWTAIGQVRPHGRQEKKSYDAYTNDIPEFFGHHSPLIDVRRGLMNERCRRSKWE